MPQEPLDVVKSSSMVVPPDNLEQLIANVTMAPNIVKATALIGVKRRAGSNMFRHQIATMGILIDYKIADPILLKASVIHDLFEDALGLPGVTQDEITRLDSDGPAVYDLVMEVTRRRIKGVPEPKAEFLLRVMQTGSMRARTLKLRGEPTSSRRRLRRSRTATTARRPRRCCVSPRGTSSR